MKINLSLSCLLLLALFEIAGCKKKKTVEPASEKIKKIWVVQAATENGTAVYTRGASGNLRDYAFYKLDLSASPSAILQEVDGKVFKGEYTVQNESELLLTNLNPQPTATGGTIGYTFRFDGENLEIKQVKASLKTGNSINAYVLVSQ